MAKIMVEDRPVSRRQKNVQFNKLIYNQLQNVHIVLLFHFLKLYFSFIFYPFYIYNLLQTPYSINKKVIE